MKKIHPIEAITCLALAAGIALCAYINAAAEEPETPETPTERAEITQPEEPAPVEVVDISEPKLAADPQPEPAPEPEPEPEPAPRYDATPAELETVARVVHSEAQGEGFDGMALVAQTVLNTAEATGKRPDEVVLAPKQYAAPAAKASEEAKAAVEAVFVDGYQVTTEPIRFFYAPARCYSSWHENSLEYVGTWGGHRFFKVKGV